MRRKNLLAAVAWRLIQLGMVLIGISTILFFLIRLSGDPVALLAGPTASEEQIRDIRSSLGLDQPLYLQYLMFLGDVVRLDFGTSIWYREPALGIALERLWPTAQLALCAVALATVIAIPIGVTAAVRPRSLLRHPITAIGLIGQSVPVFWLALVMILVFSSQLRLLPPFGYGDWQHFVMPVVALSLLPLAKLMRLVRSGMLNVMSADFVRTAKAKGVSRTATVYHHALRNAMIPVVTVVGLELAQLIGGAVITETIFSWPGIGRELVLAVSNRDYAVVQAIVFVLAVVVVVINMIVDRSYRALDPRLR